MLYARDDEDDRTTKPILSLVPEEQQEDDLVLGEFIRRPSERNRSPYVADVRIFKKKKMAVGAAAAASSITAAFAKTKTPKTANDDDDDDDDEAYETALVHVPSLDMGGKCVRGAAMLMKPARDAKTGQLVGPNAVSSKYGTPKCQYIAQLLWCDEGKYDSVGPGVYEPTWIGAHPALGERIAERCIERNLLGDAVPPVASYEREVRNVAGANSRSDFVLRFRDPALRPRIVEVKTVVDTDYQKGFVPAGTKCVFFPPPPPPKNKKNNNGEASQPYRRTAIFPWGSGKQKGPDNEPVVSSRAINQVRELTKLVQSPNQEYDATILFVVVRNDAAAFRPNSEACPSFCKYLKEARDAGVQVLAKQVLWGDGADGKIGRCYDGPMLDIEWP